jgi:hypothetical protein
MPLDNKKDWIYVHTTSNNILMEVCHLGKHLLLLQQSNVVTKLMLLDSIQNIEIGLEQVEELFISSMNTNTNT